MSSLASNLASRRYKKRNREHCLKVGKDYYKKNKKKFALKQQERNKMKSELIYRWYNKIVTGHLDYHFGSERWSIENDKKKY